MDDIHGEATAFNVEVWTVEEELGELGRVEGSRSDNKLEVLSLLTNRADDTEQNVCLQTALVSFIQHNDAGDGQIEIATMRQG